MNEEINTEYSTTPEGAIKADNKYLSLYVRRFGSELVWGVKYAAPTIEAMPHISELFNEMKKQLEKLISEWKN